MLFLCGTGASPVSFAMKKHGRGARATLLLNVHRAAFTSRRCWIIASLGIPPTTGLCFSGMPPRGPIWPMEEFMSLRLVSIDADGCVRIAADGPLTSDNIDAD